MKKNDWILIAAVGLYSFLFYQQSAGINFLIFTVAMIVALLIRDKNILKGKNWKLAAVGSILSALCIVYYGNGLSVTANIISLSILSGLSISDKSSVILSLLFSIFSYCSSTVFIIIDWVERKQKESLSKASPASRKFMLVLIPFLITLLFFFMYRGANVLFNEFAKKINLDFISWNWVMFTLGGFLLLYGFFYHKKLQAISDSDENAPNNLAFIEKDSTIIFGKQIAINDENFSGKMLFIFLNLLLLIVNILDFNFLFIDHTLPKGITYSEFVHQGTGMIITSIIVAIAIILFYFRGAINFYEKNKIIKLLAYFWVIQNVFMLISAALKNNLYINEYTLTYKRIGVYFYLFLSAIGLLTVFIKIVKVKSNNFLFRINGWLFYGVLMLSCFFNWDNLVTDYNINKSKSLDKFYLAALSSTNLPQLFILQNDSLTKHKELSVEDSDWDSFRSSEYILANYNLKNFDLELSRKLFWFMCRNENSEWKSWNYDDYKTYKDLVHLNAEKKIQKINLYSTYVESLETLKNFNNINELQLGKNKIWNIKELHYFPELKKLDLSYNKIATLKGIDTLTHLECLSIYGNQLYDYSPLYLLKELKELYIPSAIPDFQFLELQKNLPNTKIVKS